MSVKEDQIDSANVGGLNALAFDEENQERRSWKFFNSRLPRSEVVYFTLANKVWMVMSWIGVWDLGVVAGGCGWMRAEWVRWRGNGLGNGILLRDQNHFT